MAECSTGPAYSAHAAAGSDTCGRDGEGDDESDATASVEAGKGSYSSGTQWLEDDTYSSYTVTQEYIIDARSS